MRVRNTYPVALGFPDGKFIAPGESCDVTDEMAKVSGVAAFLKAGWLVEEAPAPEVEPEATTKPGRRK